MKTLTLLACISIPFFSFTSCNYSPQKTGEDFLTEAMDTTVVPGVDFFQYATGKWMKENPIPESERYWGLPNLVDEETYNRLRGILKEAAVSNAPAGSNKQKIGDFYFTGMDTSKIEEQGISPVQAELDKINSIKTKKDLFETTAMLQREGVAVLFEMFVEQDAKNSEQEALYLWQGGLGLPNREYYFRNDERTKNIRTEYKKHVIKMSGLLGKNYSDSKENLNSIYQIEKFLADSSRKLEDLRDPYANYNKMSVKELQKMTPSIDWELMLGEMGAGNIDSVIVGQPEFYQALNAAINKFSISQLKAYLKFHFIEDCANTLNSKIDKEYFHFRGTIMGGVKEQRPRWKRIQDATENAMGELMGQIYVEKYYSPKTKKRYEKIVDDLIDAFANRIRNLDWMSDSTKQKALAKLYSITKKVGYPDKWKDFSKLTINRDSYARNSIMAKKFWFDRDINKLGKPVDKTEWDMTPQTWNAYYNPSNNEIVLPAAAFIVPGVPDSLVDDAVAYAYAGAGTIGHEMTHGFDDEGRLYDANGNLHNWWTKKDEGKFKEKTKLMVEQFDNYVVLDSMHINGKATLGENIADLGGLVIGWDAFQKTDEFKEGKKINGLTPGQRFWLGYAYSWLGHMRPELLARLVLTDVHSPNSLRVNGPFSNLPAFYKTFNIKPGQPMWRPPDKRVKIW